MALRIVRKSVGLRPRTFGGGRSAEISSNSASDISVEYRSRMTSYFARSASFQGIANLPKLLQTRENQTPRGRSTNFRSGSKTQERPRVQRMIGIDWTASIQNSNRLQIGVGSERRRDCFGSRANESHSRGSVGGRWASNPSTWAQFLVRAAAAEPSREKRRRRGCLPLASAAPPRSYGASGLGRLHTEAALMRIAHEP